MLFAQGIYGLYLDYDLVKTHEVGNIGLVDGFTLVEDTQLSLGVEGYASRGKLPFKALLIHLFRESVPELAVDFENCAAYGIALFRVYGGLRIHAASIPFMATPDNGHRMFSSMIYGADALCALTREGTALTRDHESRAVARRIACAILRRRLLAWLA